VASNSEGLPSGKGQRGRGGVVLGRCSTFQSALRIQVQVPEVPVMEAVETEVQNIVRYRILYPDTCHLSLPELRKGSQACGHSPQGVRGAFSLRRVSCSHPIGIALDDSTDELSPEGCGLAVSGAALRPGGGVDVGDGGGCG
jgi:hypothetical protein